MNSNDIDMISVSIKSFSFTKWPTQLCHECVRVLITINSFGTVHTAQIPWMSNINAIKSWINSECHWLQPFCTKPFLHIMYVLTLHIIVFDWWQQQKKGLKYHVSLATQCTQCTNSNSFSNRIPSFVLVLLLLLYVFMTHRNLW